MTLDNDASLQSLLIKYIRVLQVWSNK